MKSKTKVPKKVPKKLFASLPVLTPENYYSPENTAISNSKVSDFLKSREYYFRKHIAKDLPRRETRAMKLGSIVDDILSQQEPQYQVKIERSCMKKEDPERYDYESTLIEDQKRSVAPELLVSQDMWDEAQKRANAITKEPAYKWYLENKAQFQVAMMTMLSIEGLQIPFCGMADVVTETEDIVYIDDFKTVGAQKVASPVKWWYNCQDMGYFRQMAGYRMLWLATHPNEKREIICRHMLSTKVEEELYKMHLFLIPDDILARAEVQLFDGISGIVRAMKDKAWGDPPVTWNDAQMLVPANYIEDTVDDDEDTDE